MRTDLPQAFDDITICDFGHIGDGGVHFNLAVKKDSPQLADPTFETTLRQWVFKIAVEDFGGSFSAEHAIGRKNQAIYDAYTSDTLKQLAASLKMITSPGKLGTVTFG
jgi:FAD/FMN-containing dehydrogenase